MEKIRFTGIFPFRAVRRMGPKAARALFENGQSFHSCVIVSAGTAFDEHTQRETRHRPVAYITITSEKGLRHVNRVIQNIRSGRLKASQPPHV